MIISISFLISGGCFSLFFTVPPICEILLVFHFLLELPLLQDLPLIILRYHHRFLCFTHFFLLILTLNISLFLHNNFHLYLTYHFYRVQQEFFKHLIPETHHSSLPGIFSLFAILFLLNQRIFFSYCYCQFCEQFILPTFLNRFLFSL